MISTFPLLPLNPHPSTLTASGALNSKTDRILVVMSRYERDLFFRGVDLAKFIGQACLIVDMVEHDAPDWDALLTEFRPTVLVSCWNVPLLPHSWMKSPTFSLRYICHVTGAVRYFAPRELFDHGVRITNWGALAGMPVAEHALLLALASLRNLGNWQNAMDAWRRGDTNNTTAFLNTRSLHGRSVGIHGFGNVAQCLVKLLRPFGVRLHAYSHGVPRELMTSLGVTPCESLDTLCSLSEVFFECEALSPVNSGSMDAKSLARLPDDAVFINVARGALIDEAALAREAREGRIRIALDVMIHEPMAADDPLFKARNGLYSPHISGPTNDWFPRCGQAALENLRRYLAGEPLENMVSPEVYDRST